MSSVFISYAREQTNVASELARKISERGYSVWWDRSLVAGEQFEEIISDQIDASFAVLAIWSDDFKSSNWCRGEARRAQNQSKLIPLRLETFDVDNMPLPYDGTHCIASTDTTGIFEALNRQATKTQARGQATTQLNDVFVIAKPTITLVDRSSTAEFRDILTEISRGGRVVRLYGPSKSGKTTLCRQAFSRQKVVEISGRSIEKMDEFYSAISAECNIAYSGNSSAVERHLIATQTHLIIDDFHRLSQRNQHAIIKRVKRLLDGGVTVVLISIPETAGTQIVDDGELLFRSATIRAPDWTDSELTEIARRGFAALNVTIDDASLRFLVWQSAKSPLLVQEYCHRICRRFDILERCTQPKALRVGPEVLSEILSKAAEDIGEHFSDLIIRRADRTVRLANGSQVSIYGLLLVAIAKTFVLQPIRFDTIAKRLKTYLAPTEAVSKADVRAVVEELIRRLSGERSKDYALGMDEKYVYILHPYFRVYLLWHFTPGVTGEHFPVDRYFLEDSEDAAEFDDTTTRREG